VLGFRRTVTAVAFSVALPAVVTVMCGSLILQLRLGRTGRRWLCVLNGTCPLIGDKKRQRQRKSEKTPISFHAESPRKEIPCNAN
jgi:hypothetical protein